MKFLIDFEKVSTQGSLKYDSKHYSFSFDTEVDTGLSSILINDLELILSLDGQILYAQGLCPHTIWQVSDLISPIAKKGALYVELDDEIVPGVSRRLNRSNRWPIFRDRDFKLIQIGKLSIPEGSVFVEYAHGCIAAIHLGELQAIFMDLRHS